MFYSCSAATKYVKLNSNGSVLTEAKIGVKINEYEGDGRPKDYLKGYLNLKLVDSANKPITNFKIFYEIHNQDNYNLHSACLKSLFSELSYSEKQKSQDEFFNFIWIICSES